MIITGVLEFAKDCAQEIKNKAIALTREKISHLPSRIKRDSLEIMAGSTTNEKIQGDVFQSDGNILIGRIFSKETYTPFTNEEMSKLTSEKLNNKFWGSYVFFQQISSHKLRIAIDPVGQFPLFYSFCPERYLIFSSDIEILINTLNLKGCFDWSYLTNFLVFGNIISERSSFSVLKEIPAGCSIDISKDKVSLQVTWNPQAFTQVNNNNSDNSLSDISKTLFNTVKAWTKPYQNLCLDFSGGLESTSLALTINSLFQEEKKLIGINVFHPSVAISNELSHAKKTAEMLDMELIEFNYERSLPFTPVENGWIKPQKPTIFLSHEKYESELGNILNSYSSSLAINGHGGDTIYMGPPMLSSISDYFLECGMKGIKEKILDLCFYYRIPIFNVIGHTAKELISYVFSQKKKLVMYDHWKATWLDKTCLKLIESKLVHPFQQQHTKISPGKMHHIDGVYDTLASIHVNLRNKHLNIFYPFFHQPLVEHALTIPTYHSLQKGYDRYSLRHSISNTYREANVWRRHKGETSGVIQLGIRKNLKYITEICLEGQMAARKMIDKEALQQQIQLMASGHMEFAWPLVHLFCLERYLSYWS